MSLFFKIFKFVTFIVFVSTSLPPAFAAKPVKPPIDDFYKDRYVIAEFKAKAQSDDGLITLEKVSDIWGRAKTTEVLKLPKRESVPVQVGEKYIVVFSYLRKHPIYRDVIEENPEGPTIVHGLAGAAIYRSDVALKYLFNVAEKAHVTNQVDDAGQVIDAILTLLIDDEKPRERRLAAFQFMLSNDLHKQLNTKQTKAYRNLLKSQELPDLEQELLLTAARAMPMKQRKKWLVNLCRKTVDSAGVEFDLLSLVPLKVRTCVRIIGDEVEDKDVDRLTALLYSNAPGVSKASLRTLVSWNEEQALEIFRQVLDSNQPVHTETRRVLLTKVPE